jgi:hypothetical protein
MFFLIGVVVAWSAAIVGYSRARKFVRERLRYVDSVHNTFVPLKVGLIAAAVAVPIAWALPFVTAGAGVIFGTAVGCGVASGRKDIRNRRHLASSYQ